MVKKNLKKISFFLVLLAIMLSSFSGVFSVGDSPSKITGSAIGDATTKYVIITNIPTSDAYYQAVTKLKDYRSADVISFDPNNLAALKNSLISLNPRYVAIVMKPIDITVNFPRQFLMMSTELDDDPFSDFSYGFITGATAQDCLNFVNNIIKAESDKSLGAGGIKDMPLKIGGYSGSSLSFVYTTCSDSPEDKLASACSHIYLNGTGDPGVKTFFANNQKYLKNLKLISIGSNADPHMTWLFAGQDHHYDLPDDWNYDPAKVENPPVQRLGITSDDIRALGSLYPAVVYTGACHTGAVKQALVTGDIVGTWGDTNGKVRLYTMSDKFSYALAMLNTNITGYFAPSIANTGVVSNKYIEDTFLHNEPLGDISKRGIDVLVMGFLGNEPKFRLYVDGADEQTYDVLPSGTYDPSKEDFYGALYMSDIPNRLYFGDPLYNPFAKNHDDTKIKIVYATLTKVSSEKVEVNISAKKPEGYDALMDNLYHGSFESAKIYTTVELPTDFDSINVAIISSSLTYKRLIYALEKFDGKKIAHIEIDVPYESGKSIMDPLSYNASLYITKKAITTGCGNKNCESGETYSNCIADCGQCETAANCNDGNSCTKDSCSSPRTPNATCSYTSITSCTNSDGCCPGSCTSSNDNDCAATPTNSMKLWQYNIGSNSYGSSAVADIDSDSKLEVVFGTYYNGQKAYALNGEDGSLAWSFSSNGGPIDTSVAIDDIENDGTKEVLFSDSLDGTLFCVNGKTGAKKWGYKMATSTDTPPAVGDINKDSKKEIIVADFNGKVYALNSAGSAVIWSANIGYRTNAAPALVDLYNSGNLDVILTTWCRSSDPCDWKAVALNGSNGNVLWSFNTTRNVYNGVSFADVNKDGKPEVIFGSADGYLYLLKNDGTLLLKQAVYRADSAQSSSLDYGLQAPASIADLNKDGNTEIVISGIDLYVFSYSSGKLTRLWAYDNEPDTITYDATDIEANTIFRGASIADINGDGTLDVVFGNSAGNLTVLKGSDGTLIKSFNAALDYGKAIFNIDHAPTIADFNNDGKLEIFFVGGAGFDSASGQYVRANNYGRAYLLNGSGGSGNGWNMMKHDLQHSGNFDFSAIPPSNTCSDGTVYGSCSTTKPKYCSSGNLINDCVTCGCLSGQNCLSDGSCIINQCTDTCISLGYDCGTQTVCGASVSCGTCSSGYACTNGKCVASSSDCTDSDGGKDIYVKGTTTGISIGTMKITYTDSCYSSWLSKSSGVYEYSCKTDGHVLKESFACSGGCSNGACIGGCTDTCTSLGYECGTQTVCGASTSCGTCSSGKTCTNGKCTASCTDTCTSLGYECGTQTICGASTSCGTCGTGLTCTNGKCVSSCTDTCSSLGYECGTQTVCGVSTSCGTCASGKTCSGGKCVASSSDCIDSDGGKNYNVKGTTTGLAMRGGTSKVSFTDSCYSSGLSGSVVYEYYCNTYNVVTKENHACPSGCSNGACIGGCTDTCTSLGYECGTQTVCGASTSCGTCSSGKTCTNGKCVANQTCTDTCTSLGYQCGTQTVCGASTSCGTCSSGYACTNGKCVANQTCTDTCTSLGYECGTQTVCGVSTSCGTCASGKICSNGKCIVSASGCTDTDGGKDYYTEGTVVDKYGTYTDLCYSTKIFEYYCLTNDMSAGEWYNCTYGCTTKGQCNSGAPSQPFSLGELLRLIFRI